MGTSNGVNNNGTGGGLTSAQVQALIDASIASSGSIPEVNGNPSPLVEGSIWKDTSQNPHTLMTYKNGVVREFDVLEGIVIQDLSGNNILID